MSLDSFYLHNECLLNGLLALSCNLISIRFWVITNNLVVCVVYNSRLITQKIIKCLQETINLCFFIPQYNPGAHTSKKQAEKISNLQEGHSF